MLFILLLYLGIESGFVHDHFCFSEGLPTSSKSLFADLSQSIRIRLLELVYDLHRQIAGYSASHET